MDDETKSFLEELEKKHDDKKITYKTYATWFGSGEGIIRQFGVFLYKIDNIFYYEDFERKPQFFGLPIKIGKNKTPYVKYENSFETDKVDNIMEVSKSSAENVIRGSFSSEKLKQIKGLSKIFTQTVSMIRFTDGKYIFLELMDKGEFEKALN